MTSRFNNNIQQKQAIKTLLIGVLLTFGTEQVWADVVLTSKFTNQGSITNTRHNLTQSTIGGGSVVMNPYRNDYGEVCVYCHTPHGANSQIGAPLWNRTISSATYKTYDQLQTNSFSGDISAPGINSITCLSCHDGTLGVDSIINMPGSGKYSKAQETAQSNTFLNSEWNNSSGADASVHLGLSTEGCLVCHDSAAGPVGSGATDFSSFALGTDLTNDHPIGVLFPIAKQGSEYNTLAEIGTKIASFDSDNSGGFSKGDIRVFDTGDGFEVECASCHDPHGVPSAGAGSVFNASFLRINNAQSKVCLTCHIK